MSILIAALVLLFVLSLLGTGRGEGTRLTGEPDVPLPAETEEDRYTD